MAERDLVRELSRMRMEIAELRERVERSPVRLASGGGPMVNAFWARITSSSGAAHAWSEARPNASGVLSDLAGGRTGTTSAGAAYEENGRQGIPADTHILIKPLLIGTTLIHLFTLGAGLPTGNEASVGSTGETEAANTTTWDVTSQPSNEGLALTTCTRMAYDDTGDEKLYAYYRVLTFDSNGMLVAVGAETRVTIETPEAC